MYPKPKGLFFNPICPKNLCTKWFNFLIQFIKKWFNFLSNVCMKHFFCQKAQNKVSKVKWITVAKIGLICHKLGPV
jgi:hypothetical protein